MGTEDANGYSSHWKPGSWSCLVEHRLPFDAMQPAALRRLRFVDESGWSYCRLEPMPAQYAPVSD